MAKKWIYVLMILAVMVESRPTKTSPFLARKTRSLDNYTNELCSKIIGLGVESGIELNNRYYYFNDNKNQIEYETLIPVVEIVAEEQLSTTTTTIVTPTTTLTTSTITTQSPQLAQKLTTIEPAPLVTEQKEKDPEVVYWIPDESVEPWTEPPATTPKSAVRNAIDGVKEKAVANPGAVPPVQASVQAVGAIVENVSATSTQKPLIDSWTYKEGEQVDGYYHYVMEADKTQLTNDDWLVNIDPEIQDAYTRIQAHHKELLKDARLAEKDEEFLRDLQLFEYCSNEYQKRYVFH